MSSIHMMTKMSYFRIKYQCLLCGSNFIICTSMPERLSINNVFCPECGTACGALISHEERVDGEVDDEVPGSTPRTELGKNLVVEQGSNGGWTIVSLNPACRDELIIKGQLPE